MQNNNHEVFFLFIFFFTLTILDCLTNFCYKRTRECFQIRSGRHPDHALVCPGSNQGSCHGLHRPDRQGERQQRQAHRSRQTHRSQVYDRITVIHLSEELQTELGEWARPSGTRHGYSQGKLAFFWKPRLLRRFSQFTERILWKVHPPFSSFQQILLKSDLLFKQSEINIFKQSTNPTAFPYFCSIITLVLL